LWDKATGANTRVEQLKGASFRWAPGLPANIRVGRKGLPRSKISTLFKYLYITDTKSFIALELSFRAQARVSPINSTPANSCLYSQSRNFEEK
jgi:hypothetical protein